MFMEIVILFVLAQIILNLMSKFVIDVYDNFFNESDRNRIIKELSKPKWSFSGGTLTNRFWHIDDLELENYFSDYLKNIILDKLNLNDVECLRIYANGQTAGQSGYPHTDDGHYTFLYFPNDWQIDWQGHLHFINRSGPEYEDTLEWNNWNLDKPKLKTDEVVKTITYKPNRAVLFSGNILHYAGAPHRLHVGLRTSLAYKFVKK